MSQGRRLGRYELLDTQGEGEILTVYRARDTERNRPVILKLVHPHLQDDAELIARFQRRAEDLLSLRHAHIVSALDASFEKDAFYLVTEIPEGESLERRCAGHSPMEVDDVLSIISQVAQALDYAYRQGVGHHDVRPTNIFLKQKSAVLANFHLLEAVGATPTYMSPEQLDETSAEAVDQRSDAYALGVVVYTMLTGRPPFEGTAADVAAAHLAQRPLPPRVHNPGLFPALDAILLKALAKQPQSRYQSAGELAAALHEAVRTAQTRRMTDGSIFDNNPSIANKRGYNRSSSHAEGGVPAWIWVGLGILLIVVVVTIILLATG